MSGIDDLSTRQGFSSLQGEADAGAQWCHLTARAFKTWITARLKTWRAGAKFVAVDGCTGYKTAASEELPDATTVMDPLHVSRLAGETLDGCRHRALQTRHGHRGRAGDPLCRARRTLRTGRDLLTPRQNTRLEALFAVDEHVRVEITWSVHQEPIVAHRGPDRCNHRSSPHLMLARKDRKGPRYTSAASTLCGREGCLDVGPAEGLRGPRCRSAQGSEMMCEFGWLGASRSLEVLDVSL